MPGTFGNQLGHGLAGQVVHFERALNALYVIDVDSFSGLRVDAFQFRVQCRPARLLRHHLDHVAHCFIGRRQVAQPLAQSLEIEHGASDQQRNAPALGDVGHELRRVVAKLRR